MKVDLDDDVHPSIATSLHILERLITTMSTNITALDAVVSLDVNKRAHKQSGGLQKG